MVAVVGVVAVAEAVAMPVMVLLDGGVNHDGEDGNGDGGGRGGGGGVSDMWRLLCGTGEFPRQGFGLSVTTYPPG